MPPSIKLWVVLVKEAAPILTESAAELLYYRAVSAWASGYQLTIPNGLGENVDLTKIYEQCKLLATLKAEHK